MTDLAISSSDAKAAAAAAKPPSAPALPEKPTPTATTNVPTNPAGLDPNTLEHPLDAYVKGYPKIAHRMGLVPETAMFRRFGALNARNLLYLQQELAVIEKKLIKQEWDDNQSQGSKKCKYAIDARWLHSATSARDGDTKQKDLILEMRNLLNQYSESMHHVWPTGKLMDW